MLCFIVANTNATFVTDTTAVTYSTKSDDKGTVILSLNRADDKTSVCCMDFQAVGLTPRIKASSLQNKIVCLSLYVLQPRHKGRSGYLWHEGEGALIANEFASSVTYSFADSP